MFFYSYPAPETTVLVLVDMQERLLAAMDKTEVANVVSRQKIILDAASELQMPVIVTEQYPKGLGKTIPDISSVLANDVPVIEKTTFSCFGEISFRKEIERRTFKTMILVGVETHVCIQQTALDALHRGFQVFIPSDAVSSRRVQDASESFEMMRQMGVYVTTSESLLFSIIRDASNPAFKKISKLLK